MGEEVEAVEDALDAKVRRGMEAEGEELRASDSW